jgi:hypothetical protein
MPRASEINQLKKLRLLVYGVTGSGKTTLFRSLPGKKFLFVFDPAGLCSIQPEDDIEFETFIPSNLNMSVNTIKGYDDNNASYGRGSDTYNTFEKYCEEKTEENYFDSFDWIGLDSWTTLQDLILDKVACLYGREGKNPDLADYGILADSLRRVIRNFTGIGCNLFCSSHEKATQDKLLRTVNMGIMVPGQMQTKLPLLFSDIYHLRALRDGDKVRYFMDTAPDDMYPLARCSMNLEPTEEITLPVKVKDITEYGLGKILRERGFYANKE